MQNFINILFPEEISNESSYKIITKNNLNKFLNGTDYRVKIQNTPNLKFAINKKVFTKKMTDDLISFFRVTNGSFYSFKFKDPFDNYLSEESFYKEIGEGIKKFALFKNYKTGGFKIKRRVYLPDLSTFRVREKKKNGEINDINYTWNQDSMLFEIENSIQIDSILQIELNFFILVRFENDILEINSLESKNYYSINNLLITEIINNI